MANEPAKHALGRPRGGLSTKIHALTDVHCCPLTHMLARTDRGNPCLAPLLEAHRARETTAFRLLANKAYSHPRIRKQLRDAESHVPSPNAATRSPAARPRARPAVDHPHSTSAGKGKSGKCELV